MGKPFVRRTSGFVGVCWNIRVQKWEVQSRVAGKTIYLGYFATEEAAACKYDVHAKSLNRPVNFPSGDQIQAHKCASRFPKGMKVLLGNEPELPHPRAEDSAEETPTA